MKSLWLVFLLVLPVFVVEGANRLAWNTVTVESGGVTNTTIVNTWSYDPSELVVHYTSEYHNTDQFGDKVDEKTSGINYCDVHWQPTQTVWQVSDTESDQFTTTTVTSTQTVWSSYNPRGELTRYWSTSISSDPQWDSTSSGDYEYNNRGLEVQFTSEQTQPGGYVLIFTETRSYNARGQPLSDVLQQTNTAGYASTISTTWTYDNNRGPATQLIVNDFSGYGVPESSVETTYAYDRSGTLTQAFNRTLDARGHVVATSTETFTYNQKGEELMHTISTDENNDGIVDTVEVDRFGYVDVPR